MQNLAFPDSGWLDTLLRLPSDLDLNQLARDTGAIQRYRGITDAADLLRLGLTRGPGGKTLKQTAAWVLGAFSRRLEPYRLLRTPPNTSSNSALVSSTS